MKHVQVLLLVVLALLMCGVFSGVAQAESYVQQCAEGNTSSTSNCKLSSVTAGDMIVVGCQNVSASTSQPTISDGTNTYTITPHSPATGMVWIAYAANVKSGSPTVSCTVPSGDDAGMWALEFKGVGALDTDAYATSSSGTAVDTPTLTPSVAGEAPFAIAVVGGNVTAAGGGWTLCPTTEDGNAREYQILTSTTATAVNMTETGGTGWFAVEAAVKPASGTAPAAPVAAAVSSITSTGFTANWAASSGATGYYLDASTSSSFSSFVSGYDNLSVGNVTSSAVSGLTASTTYYYRVRASNSYGTSGNSSTITVTTSASSGSMPAPPGYSNLVFDDLFPGPSLNSSKWIAEIGDQTAFPWEAPGMSPPLSAIGMPGQNNAEYDSPSKLLPITG